MKTLVLGLCMLCFPFLFLAQQTPVEDLIEQPAQERLYEVLRNIDRSPMSSGLWLDWTVARFPWDQVQVGTSHPLVMDYTYFKSAYLNLYMAQTQEYFEDPEAALSTIVHNKSLTVHAHDKIPLGLIHVRAERIKPAALDDGLLTLDAQNNLHSVEGKNPFESLELMLLSPLVSQVQGLEFEFELPNDLVFSNIGTTQKKGGLKSELIRFQINADDGQGLRDATVNTPGVKAGGFGVSYSSSGLKTLTFVLDFADGSQYSTQAKLEILPAAIPESGYPGFSIDPVMGRHAGGTAQILYGCGNNGILFKPLIVVEGFDPEGENELSDFLRKAELLVNGIELKKLLETEGYDIVYLNFNDATDDIWRNAEVLRDLITEINELKSRNGSSYPNVVLGESMGGLVARCALREMELDSGDEHIHQTETFISWDSPHNGANIPLAFQLLLAEIHEFELSYIVPSFFELEHDLGIGFEKKTLRLRDFFPEVTEALAIANSPASRQMILRSPLRPDSYEPSLALHFFTTINAPEFGMPRGVDHLLALNNGSQTAHPQALFPGSNLFNLDVTGLDVVAGEWRTLMDRVIACEGKYRFLNVLGLHLGVIAAFLVPTALKINVKALPTQSSDAQQVGFLRLNIRMLNRIPIPVIHRKFKVIDEVPIDHVSGGIGVTTGSFGDLDLDESNIPGELFFAPGFCFIPTPSSSALKGSHARNYHYHVQNNGAENNPHSFFKTLSGPAYSYAPQTHNEAHASISIGGAQFLAQHLVNEDVALDSAAAVLHNENAFNYATTTQYNPRNRIHHSVRVEAGAYLGINADKPAGYRFDNHSGGQSDLEAVRVSAGCGSHFVQVTIEEDAELILGSSDGRKGSLTFMQSTGLELKAGAKVFIHDHSTLELTDWSILNLSGDVEIHLLGPHARFIVRDSTLLTGAIEGGTLKIQGTGQMDVYQPLAFSNTDLELSARLHLHGHAWSTHSDMDIDMHPDAELHVLSRIAVNNGAHLHITGGTLFTNNGSGGTIILGSPQGRLQIDEVTINGSLTIDANPLDDQQLDFVQINDSELRGNLYCDVPRIDMGRCEVYGELNLASYADSSSGYPPLCRIHHSVFHSGGIRSGIYSTSIYGDANAELPIAVSQCTFLSGSSIVSDYGNNMEITYSNFEGDAHVVLHHIASSKLEGNHFTGTSDHVLQPSLHVVGGWNHQLSDNVFSGCATAVRLDDNAAVALACNELSENDYGLVVGGLSVALVNGLMQGNNTIVNNVISNVHFDVGRKIDFTAGGNLLYNHHPSVNVNPGPDPLQHFYWGSIFSGVMVGANACPPELPSAPSDDFQQTFTTLTGQDPNLPSDPDPEPIYEVSGNQWSQTYPLQAPQVMNPNRFHLFVADIRDEVECKGCKTQVVDPAVKLYSGCSITDEQENPLSGNRRSALVVKHPCVSCPVITSGQFQGMRLDEAVGWAMGQTHMQGSSSNPSALEALTELLIQDYGVVNTREVYDFLQTAWLYARLSAAQLAESGDGAYAKTMTDAIVHHFHPQDYVGTTPLDVLGYVLDQARLQKHYGDINAALELLYDTVDHYDDFAYVIDEQIMEYELLLEVQVGVVSPQSTALSYSVGGGMLEEEPEEGGYRPCFTYAANPYARSMQQGSENTTLDGLTTATHAHTTSITSSKKQAKTSRVYPNPVMGRLFVDAAQPMAYLQIKDLAGRVVMQMDQGVDSQGSVDVSKLAGGSYVVELLDTQKQVIYREQVVVR